MAHGLSGDIIASSFGKAMGGPASSAGKKYKICIINFLLYSLFFSRFL